jgi:hypothetical protein
MTIARAVLLSAAALAAGCGGGTAFRSTWVAPDAKPGTFQGKKVAAVYITADEGLRRGVETTLAAELTRLGAVGVPAYSIIPAEENKDQARAKARLAQAGAAGIVTMRLVGRDQETTASSAGYYVPPSYASAWSGYWGYGWGGVYDAGYLKTETILHVETLVFSLEQDKLVWAGQSRSADPAGVPQLVRELVGKVAAEVRKAGLVAGR